MMTGIRVHHRSESVFTFDRNERSGWSGIRKYWDVATFPGVVVPCGAPRVIPVEQNRAGQGRGRNDRILTLPIHARREADLVSATAPPNRVRDKLEHFFMALTVLERRPEDSWLARSRLYET
jgi:hypothetical protein